MGMAEREERDGRVFVGGWVSPEAKAKLQTLADRTHRNVSQLLEHLGRVLDTVDVNDVAHLIVSLEDPKRTPPEMRRCDSGEGAGDA